MNTNRILSLTVLAGILVTTGCGPRLVPVARNGEVMPNRSEPAVEQARRAGELERVRLGEALASSGIDALVTCAPAICDAVARGEVTIGMTEAQVLAATRTTAEAWAIRPSGTALLMTAQPAGPFPRDALGEIAYVGLQNGMVSSYTYRESQGLRTVVTAADATAAGRAVSQAEALVREGDAHAVAGRLDLALDWYDRADIVRPNHPETTLRIATTLDKQLRPLEAIMRYQLFIHQMELELIEARGEAAARMAEAIARAHERIIVLERR